MATSALQKENDSLERRVESRDKKLDTIMRRGMFVGGAIGGAALGAIVDVRFGTIWGFPASSFLAAVGIAAVLSDRVGRKWEDTVLAVSLGMAAKPVYDKTVKTIGEGLFGGLFGNGNGGGNGGAGG